MGISFDKVDKEVGKAVRSFWQVRQQQSAGQTAAGRSDQGARGAVTGGRQMQGFARLISKLVVEAGTNPDCVFLSKSLELPGFFRPTKEWDLLVIKDDALLAAVELKSQVGPSFGNNFNNRTEEAMGSALDLWTAYREQAFGRKYRPWLGYLFLLEDCPASQSLVRVREPHFKVFPEFKGAS